MSDSGDAAFGTIDDLSPTTHATRRALVTRGLLLVLCAVILYGFAPQFTDLFQELPDLQHIRTRFFVVMVGCEILSFACMWRLIHLALPGVGRFVIATSQLAGNALSRVMPGGGAGGAATSYRMLAVAGVERGRAGAALAANSLISTGVLASLPLLAIVWSFAGLRLPDSLEIGAWVGAGLFVVLFTSGFALIRSERAMRAFATAVERVSGFVLRLIGRPGGPTAASLVEQRDRLVINLGPRWKRAFAAAAGNWLFDYLALVTALYAVGARPKPALVLVAYAGAAVLAMIPLTPGGLGFVEAGLTSMLVAAHVQEPRALLATLAYRLVSYWLPLVAGLVAWVWFRRRYGHRRPSGGTGAGGAGGAPRAPGTPASA